MSSQVSPGQKIRRESIISVAGTLEYTLYVRPASEHIHFYSIEVTLDRGGTVDRNTAADITTKRDTADFILQMLVHGEVTPCTVNEVIEDLIESMPEEIFREGTDQILPLLS